ncbi:MAG: anthranilate synthase component I [Alphaproteobacteria bacterium]
MEFFPPQPKFEAAYSAGKAQVVYRQILADTQTTISALMKIGAEVPYTSLFESVEGGANLGRYSFIALAPDVLWKRENNQTWINRIALHDRSMFELEEDQSKNPLDSLAALHHESFVDMPDELPPMSAGLVGFFSYDTVRHIEHLPTKNPDVLATPEAVFMRPTITAVFDRVKDLVTLVTPVYPKSNLNSDQAYEEATKRISELIDLLEGPLPSSTAAKIDIELPEAISNIRPEDYMNLVARAKKYIAAGDIFQVVLSQRFSVPYDLSAFSLYRSLRRLNPSPFLFYLNFDGFSLVGSSPEILVRSRQGEVTIRPIAGTRPRGSTPADDKALAEDLLADPKECAEHLMLLDLGRNDVGRVAEIGSVNVTDKFFVELYSHVMHIVSNVTGKLKHGLTAIDAMKAGFPAGTVSGAPKVRAMQIIDEFEPDQRGPYAGAVGYLAANGDMDSTITLRTGLVKDGMLHVQAGAGIVADSVPEMEQAECENKAKAILRAAMDSYRYAKVGTN